MQGHRVRTCWGRDTEAGFSDLHLLSLSIAPRLLKEAWGGPGVLGEDIGLLDHIVRSQLVHSWFTLCSAGVYSSCAVMDAHQPRR